jgi:Asp-tRNA(Asn)/Glu-tRNA(Gln) amidotransferase A subunit family amidase
LAEVVVSKKWYNLFVSVDQAAGGDSEAAQPPADSASSAAQAVADIAASVPAITQFSGPVANPTSFQEIYTAAAIQPPEHGYTIMKVADMLQSEHLRGLPAEVRRSTILVALEAAGVKIQDVIEDAVKRDRALDTYEHVLEKSVHDLEAGKADENAKIQAEMERLVAEHRSRIQANDDAVAKEKERFFGWRLQKQQEEKKIADAVGYFVSENPITTSGSPAPPPPKT